MGYNRRQRTARFPVKTRESPGFRRHSATTKIVSCTRQEVAGSNPVSPTKWCLETSFTIRSPSGGRFCSFWDWRPISGLSEGLVLVRPSRGDTDLAPTFCAISEAPIVSLPDNKTRGLHHHDGAVSNEEVPALFGTSRSSITRLHPART